MNNIIQSIIVSLIFVYALWQIYKYAYRFFDNKNCSGSCSCDAQSLKEVIKKNKKL